MGGVGSPVEGGLCVAGLLLNLLQPGALQLGPRVTAAQPGPGLGRVVIIQLPHRQSLIVNYADRFILIKLRALALNHKLLN